jgi:hypothetical protein
VGKVWSRSKQAGPGAEPLNEWKAELGCPRNNKNDIAVTYNVVGENIGVADLIEYHYDDAIWTKTKPANTQNRWPWSVLAVSSKSTKEARKKACQRRHRRCRF